MKNNLEIPAALAGADRNADIKALPSAYDTRDDNGITGQRLAALIVARRYGVSVEMAPTICFLAGIGGDT